MYRDDRGETEFPMSATNNISDATWMEYDRAARWCVANGLSGNVGDALPDDITPECRALIESDRDTFASDVSDWADATDENEDPNDCPECARSFGPHYAGPCEH